MILSNIGGGKSEGDAPSKCEKEENVSIAEADVSIEEGVQKPTVICTSDKAKTSKKSLETYKDRQIKILSRSVILIAVGILIVQIVWIILRFTLIYYRLNMKEIVFWINFFLSICISLTVLTCGYYGVIYKNPTCPFCCLGVGYLDLYQGLCAFGVIFYLFFSIWWAIYLHSYLAFIMNILLVVLCAIGEGRVDGLLTFLSDLHENSAEEDKITRTFCSPLVLPLSSSTTK